MFLICPQCGQPADHAIHRTAPGHADAVCPSCGHLHPFHFRPLPVITGASGSGKSTLALRLGPLSQDIFCFENDILWQPCFDTPGDGYHAFRTSLLRVALNVNQSRVTTALFSSVMPHDLGAHSLARYFDGLSFLVLSCPDEVLAARLRARPRWRASGDDVFISAMQTFNGHLRRTEGENILHLDTSTVTEAEAEVRVRRWIDSILTPSTG